jgi:hypothetical protein
MLELYRRLRNSREVVELSEEGLSNESRRQLGAGELVPFGELLMDALRWLPPNFDVSQKLWRDARLD